MRTGRLLRLRQGAYAPAEVDPGCVEAARLGGRLTCLSELTRLGVFVLENHELHVHLPASAARPATMRHPVQLHWQRLRRSPHPQALSVEPFDAVRHAVLCQPRRAAIATVDSALHLGLIRVDELDELFDSLPRRFRPIRKRLDARADSGSESLMRLILSALHCSFEPQVRIEDVGTVDFLVDGWLIVECDSQAHHSDWAAQRRDRRRDQAAAALGYVVYRPIAEDIMWRPDVVREAVVGILRGRRRR